MTLTQQILEYIREHPGCARKDILQALPEGTNANTVSCTMHRLQTNGAIENRGGFAQYAEWYAVPNTTNPTFLRMADDILAKLAMMPVVTRRDYLATKLEEIS